jgi:hypothetical protein
MSLTQSLYGGAVLNWLHQGIFERATLAMLSAPRNQMTKVSAIARARLAYELQPAKTRRPRIIESTEQGRFDKADKRHQRLASENVSWASKLRRTP